MTSQSSWIVVATQPRWELFVEENLVRQSHNVYCPLIAKRVRHARRIYEVKRPLFPGYLFVERKPSFIFSSILRTYSVRSVVRDGDAPASLPSDFVASLRAREIEGVIKQQEAAFKPRPSLTIDSGPFEGVVGHIIEARENDRVLLLLDLIHSQAELNVNTKMLRSA